MTRISLQLVVKRLESAYGRPAQSGSADPWQLILSENVAYLANDERRQLALNALRNRVGTLPDQIIAAPREALHEAAGHGIMPEIQIEKLRRCAQIALQEFDGNVKQILGWPIPKAKKALQKFPGIGAPGADKILLLCHRQPTLALDSNGLRVLVRLGFGQAKRDYSTTYRLVQADISREPLHGYARLVAAFQLLRRHGQEVCRRIRPSCERCPLKRECGYYSGFR